MNSGFPQILENQLHLPHGEEAAVVGVAVLFQSLIERDVQLYPRHQPVDGSVDGDVRSVCLCQFALGVGSYLHATKIVKISHTDKRRELFIVCYRILFSSTGSRRVPRHRRYVAVSYLCIVFPKDVNLGAQRSKSCGRKI